MKLRTLLVAAMMVGALAVIGCGDDQTTGGTGGTTGTGGTSGGPNCTQEACAANETLRANCEREYQACLDTGTLSQAECIVFAEETCTF